MNTTPPTPNLTHRAPRSARVRLGGYAMLPRILDKARATLAHEAGEYKYNNPMDREFFTFTGIAADALLEQVRSGAGDWDMFLWVRDHAQPPRAPHEVQAWSSWLENLNVGDAEDMAWYVEQVRRLNPARTDLRSVIDYLDLDDHVSFGGKA